MVLPVKAEASTTIVGKTNITVISSANGKKVTVKWKKVKDADGYIIYRKDGNKTYKKIKTVKNTVLSYVDQVSKNKTYKYKIRAYRNSDGKKVYGKYSKAITINTVPKPSKITLNKVSLYGYKNIKITWKKSNRVTKYVVYRSTNNKKFKKIGETTKTYFLDKTARDKTVATGKTFYYKVRAYRKYNGKKYFGSYSKVGNVVDEAELCKNFLKLFNEYRKKYGLEECYWDSRLEDGVKIRAKELTISYSHTRPDGRLWGSAYPKISGGVSENIYSVNGTSNKDMQEALDIWNKSTGHRRTLQAEGKQGIAVGFYKTGIVFAITTTSDE